MRAEGWGEGTGGVMTDAASRWIEDSPSQYAHEREGLAYLKANLPDAPPYRAWTNFEFMDGNGGWNEVDALVLGRRRLHLVELKHYSGTLAGNEKNWLRNGRRVEKSPLLLARRKAQRLSSRLKDQMINLARKTGQDYREATAWLPFIQECVFLHDPTLDVQLTGVARSNLFAFGGDEADALPDIIDRLTEPPQGEPVSEINSRKLTALLRGLGVIPRRPTRAAGSWLINGAPLEEGEGWQDWPAEHRVDPDREVRIRVFLTPAGSPQSGRDAIRRRVARENQLLQTLKHDSIVTPLDVVETDDGNPGLVYDTDTAHLPLDELVEPALTADQQLAVLERVADALAYAHRHRVAHRGLNPHAVLVAPPAAQSGDPGVRLADWSSVGRIHQDTASRTLLAASPVQGSDAAQLYEAPEGRLSQVADRRALDVFSLGAIAYHLLAGSAPAADRTELREKLKAGNGLDLATAGTGYVGEDLRQLVLDATRPAVSRRLTSAEEFADRLRAIRRPTPAPDDEVDILDLPAQSLVLDRYEVVKTLGEGSTARGILVHDLESDEDRVLKVGTSAEAAARLQQEAEVLRFLGTALPDNAGVARMVDDPVEVPKGRTALVLSMGGDSTLSDLTRHWAVPGPDLESLGRQLLDVMAALDRTGVLHRDVKSANLGLTPQIGGRSRLTLFDFSLARRAVSDLAAGTPPYLDPFLGGKDRPAYDSAAEWYAAAVVLYEMATSGVPVYGDGGSDPGVITDDVSVEPEYFTGVQDRPAVAAALTDFFRRALSRRTAHRFDTIDAMREAWTAAFAVRKPSRAPGRPKAPTRPTVPDGTQASTVQVPPLVDLVRELGRVAGSSGTAARKLVYLLTPTNPSEQDVDPLATQGVYAAALGVTPGRIAQVFERLVDKWHGNADLAHALVRLDETMWTQLVGGGGVSTPDHLATALLAEHFSDVDLLDVDARRIATGLVRLLLERSLRTERRLERRRYQGRIVAVAVDPLRLAVADAVAEQAARSVRSARALGSPVLPADEVLADLRAAAAGLLAEDPDGLGAPVPDQSLLRLAAIHPDVVGLSGADELYPPDLDMGVAVDLVLRGLPTTQRVRPAEIVSRVEVRFPALAGQVPDRPALDLLVQQAHPHLVWQPGDETYASGPADPSRSSTVGSVTGTQHSGPPRSPVGPLSIGRLAEGQVFRVLEVPDLRSDELADALAGLLDGQWFDVTAELLGLLRARADAAGVPWSTILAADAGPAHDRQGLAGFVEQALPELFELIENASGATGPAVLTDLATLAAYGLLGRLTRWTDVTRPPPRTILALIPRGVQAGPVVDGTSLPLNSPDQFVPLSTRDVDEITRAATPSSAGGSGRRARGFQDAVGSATGEQR